MSKKNRRQFNQPQYVPAASNDLAAEYKIIRHDLLRVVGLNIFFLAAVLVLYYTNHASGYLERWFDKILHF